MIRGMPCKLFEVEQVNHSLAGLLASTVLIDTLFLEITVPSAYYVEGFPAHAADVKEA